VTSVLECSTKLRGVQGELKIDFSIRGFCFRIIFNPAKAKIVACSDKGEVIIVERRNPNFEQTYENIKLSTVVKHIIKCIWRCGQTLIWLRTSLKHHDVV